MDNQYFDPAFPIEKLAKHPLNRQLYQDEGKRDESLVESIRQNGIRTPLIATMQNVIIAGHRRRDHAVFAELKTVPVYFVDLTDEDEIVLALISSNRDIRERTNEQKGREFKAIKAIEERRAADRQKMTQKGQKHRETAVRPNLDTPGRADSIAAEQVGLSRNTARNAESVIDTIDDLEAAGETEQAEELRDTLNRSVNGAKQKADAITKPPKPEVPRLKLVCIQGEKRIGTILDDYDEATKLAGCPDLFKKGEAKLMQVDKHFREMRKGL